MSDVGNVLVTELLNFHLIDGVRPRVEIDLAALCVERKVGYSYFTTRMQTYLGHPRDQARAAYPRIEVFHLV